MKAEAPENLDTDKTAKSRINNKKVISTIEILFHIFFLSKYFISSYIRRYIKQLAICSLYSSFLLYFLFLLIDLFFSSLS